ncbi:MAG: dimethyl sulfoxide reductase anchor subunit [Anaerolineae bacterium]|jgi:DMSO reductase anchor subunit|nr:dimethyl sulfoxide reductase anchor subunit [Anaerolineae bacterium]
MNLREWALPIYTIMMQLAIGALFSLWVIRKLFNTKYGKKRMDEIATIPVFIIFSTMIVATIGSHFHLSKPHLSFLALRNFGSSWLSREIAFTLIVFISTGALLFFLVFKKKLFYIKTFLGWAAILIGFVTIYSMANIYLLPTQVAWNSPVTIISYYAVMLLLGPVSMIVIFLMDLRFSTGRLKGDVIDYVQIIKKSIPWLVVVATITSLLNIALGLYQIELLRDMAQPSAQASLELVLGLYKPLLIMRIGFALVGIVWLNGIVSYFIRSQRVIINLLGPVSIACTLILIGEILERFLFYATHVRIGI